MYRENKNTSPQSASLCPSNNSSFLPGSCQSRLMFILSDYIYVHIYVCLLFIHGSTFIQGSLQVVKPPDQALWHPDGPPALGAHTSFSSIWRDLQPRLERDNPILLSWSHFLLPLDQALVFPSAPMVTGQARSFL